MKKKHKIRNLVAKHAQRSGAGAHMPRQGKRASRARNKKWFERFLDYMEG